jgi:hypothetical protein
MGKTVAVKVAEVQNMARHVLRIALVLWTHVALRAALESAVQLGRGDEVNRQAEIANPTRCRVDSLQDELNVHERSRAYTGACNMFAPYVVLLNLFKALHECCATIQQKSSSAKKRPTFCPVTRTLR